MALDAVDQLSDEETVVLSPSAGTENQRKTEKSPKGKGEPKTKTVKSKKDTPVPKTKPEKVKTPKEKKKPEKVKTPQEKKKADVKPEVETEVKLKRPASKLASEQPMKKPAKAVRAGKSMYKRDGVWSIKLNDKEVCRVIGLHLDLLF